MAANLEAGDRESVQISEITPACLHDESQSTSGSSSTYASQQCFSSAINGKRVAYGREIEQNKLKDVWTRVSSQAADSELIWLEGASGVGKTFLLNSVRNIVEGTNGGIFVLSKFDQLSLARREPFYAIVSALSDICEIVAADEEIACIVGRQVQDALVEDLGFFASFVPTMGRLLEVGGRNDTRSCETEDGGVESLMRTKRACKEFLACVSKHRPIFLVLDDVQWTDSESLALLQSFFTDNKSTNVCYVLCSRTDDPDKKELTEFLCLDQEAEALMVPSPVATTQKNAGRLSRLSYTTLKLETLAEEGVRKVLSGVLGYADVCHEIETLTRVTFEKTEGNLFLVVQFLQLLHEKGILTYSQETERWKWEINDKMARLDVSDNVLQSIDARIQNLDTKTRDTLVIAAHIGFRFQIEVLEVALLGDSRRKFPEVDEETRLRRISRAIDKAEKASMLFSVAERNELCFMHDRVQQCFYEMVAEGAAKEHIYLSVGRELRPMIENRDSESLRFLVADLLNLGQGLMEEQSEKMSLVELNQTVAELAIKKSSYVASSHYLRSAMSLLEKRTVWSTNYDLALNLYSSFAWASCYANEVEECDRAVETVITNSRSILDRQSAYNARLCSLEMQGRNKDVIASGILAMKELGSPLNPNPSKASVIFQILRLRSRLNKMPDADLLALPKVSDAYKAAAMDVLGRMTLSMILSNDKISTLQSSLRVLEYSLKYGWMNKTPWGICNFGLVEKMVFKNFSRAQRYASLAKDMVRAFNIPLASSEVIFQSEGLLLPWVRSWERSIGPLLRGSEMGMKYNDLYNAAMCLTIVCPLLLYTKPLGYAAEKLEFIVNTQIHIQGHSIHIHFSRPFLQQTLNLLGREESVMELNGEAMKEEELLTATLPASYMGSFYLRKLELACYFRSLVLAETWAETNPYDKGKEGLDVFCPSTVYTRFFKAITYLDIARKEKNARNLLGKVSKSIRWLTLHVKKGCYEAKPFLAVLLAERAALNQRTTVDDLRLQYDRAIEDCLEHSLPGIAALASERAYYSLRDILGEQSRSEARSYWRQALALYTEWEAFGKVEVLETMVEAEADKELPGEVGIGVLSTTDS